MFSFGDFIGWTQVRFPRVLHVSACRKPDEYEDEDGDEDEEEEEEDTTLHYATLRYATLRYATLRYATLRYATLRYAIQSPAQTIEQES